MLGVAVLLAVEILVFWQYAKGQSWIRYPGADRGPAAREALLIQCVHSDKYKMFHCEPIVHWPMEGLVIMFQC